MICQRCEEKRHVFVLGDPEICTTCDCNDRHTKWMKEFEAGLRKARLRMIRKKTSNDIKIDTRRHIANSRRMSYLS